MSVQGEDLVNVLLAITAFVRGNTYFASGYLVISF